MNSKIKGLSFCILFCLSLFLALNVLAQEDQETTITPDVPATFDDERTGEEVSPENDSLANASINDLSDDETANRFNFKSSSFLGAYCQIYFEIHNEADETPDPAIPASILGEEAKEQAQRLFNELSPYGDGEVSQINQALTNVERQSTAIFQASEHLSQLITLGLEMQTQSEGLYNILAGDLQQTWETLIRQKRIPSQEHYPFFTRYRELLSYDIEEDRDEIEIEEVEVEAVIYTFNIPKWNHPPLIINFMQEEQAAQLIIQNDPATPVTRRNATQQTVNPELGLNFGHCVYGYIADQLVIFLNNNNIARGYINFNGNVAVVGGREQVEDNILPWRLGILNPRTDIIRTVNANSVLDNYLIVLTDNTCSTTGDYSYYMENEDGKRFHNIINPKTGYPASSGFPPDRIISVTVVGSSLCQSMMLSRILFIMGIEQALLFLEENIEYYHAFFIVEEENGNIFFKQSDGMAFYLR